MCIYYRVGEAVAVGIAQMTTAVMATVDHVSCMYAVHSLCRCDLIVKPRWWF
jgi:hypothetical protein